MDIKAEALKKHYEWQGKIEVVSRTPVTNSQELSLAYTPGVAEPCLQIKEDYQKSWQLTRRSNMVAVITDGTAVLGLGDIGPEAGLPVMEGQCCLFQEFLLCIVWSPRSISHTPSSISCHFPFKFSLVT